MQILNIQRIDILKKKAVIQDEFIRKRKERQRRIRKRRLIAFFCFFFVLMVCVGITLSLTVFFPIEKINITGSKIYTSEEIEKYSGIEIGDNLFTASKKDAEKSLKVKLPYIDSIKIKREIPGTIKIIVKDADEFACYNISGRYFTVSKTGWVLKETEELPENLTEIITSKTKCSVGSQAVFSDEGQKEILNEVMSVLSANKINPQKIDVSDKKAIKISVENRFDVNLGTVNNIDEKIRHLLGMIDKIDGEKSGEINLSIWTSSKPEGTFIQKKEE